MDCKPIGPLPTSLMIVFDHATAKDVERGEILSGPAGPELKRMMKEAGLEFGMAYITAVVKKFPPKGKLEAWLPEKKKDIKEEHRDFGGKMLHPDVIEGLRFLHKEIEMVQPKVIIVMGALGLWYLTEKEGLKTYRGSILKYGDIVVIPTYSPSLIFQMWSQRVIAVQDLRRAKDALEGKNINPPDYRFIIRPTFEEAKLVLEGMIERVAQGPTILSVDIETRLGHIMCIAFAWSKTEALCIPFVETQKGSYPYWIADQEGELIYLIYKLLTHTNCRVIWQNGLYDAQYIYKAWHFIPNHYFDSMLGHHCLASYETIETLQGKKSIKELVGTTPWIWGFVKGKPKLVQVKEVRLTRRETNLIRITYWKRGAVGTGMEFKTLDVTPDHLILTKKGWVEAQNLKIKDALEPVNINVRDNGRRYLVKGKKSWPIARLSYEHFYGEIPEGKVIHHIDENPLNDLPENLQALTIYEHNKIHGKIEKWRKAPKPSKKGIFKFDYQYAKTLYDSGASQTEIAETLGIDQASVSRSFKAHGFVSRTLKEAQKLRREKENNCRVLFVQALPGFHDTYCLEVSEGDSFVTNGIVVHNCCFTTMQKSLDFLASFYCDYYQQYKGIARELTKGSLKKDD